MAYSKREETVVFNWHGLEVHATIYVQEDEARDWSWKEVQLIGPILMNGNEIPDDLFMFLTEEYDSEFNRMAMDKFVGAVGS